MSTVEGHTGGLRQTLGAVSKAGLLEPGLVAAMVTSFAWWGPSAAAAYAAAALRRPFRPAVVDDHGSLAYGQLHLRTDFVAGALKRHDVGRESTVGIMCRNHRGFIEANVAAAKLGARVVYLNTGLPGDQLAQLVERERIDVLFHDREFGDMVSEAGVPEAFLAAPEDDPSWSFPGLERRRWLWRGPDPRGGGDPVILTSGTTGVPKGARRSTRGADAAGAAGIFDVIPYHTGDVMVVPAPLFHAWGLSQHLLAATLTGTVILRQRFDPEQVLEDARRHDADVLAAVPVMLSRMLDSDSKVQLRHVRVVATSGAPLPGTLATRWMDWHGDTLYNLYGSTEVGQVAIAGPDDLRAAPGTAGKPPPGVELRILGSDGRPVGVGEVGEIVAASAAHFDGYTGGGSKELRDGAMVTGDTGYVDEHGRLFVTGRADDMIISGGENLYPAGIENALLEHPAVREAAVVGVPDDDLGQRVRAVVVVSDRKKASVSSLRAHAKARLATYECPREYVFVDELPRNPTGKILRSHLS